MCLHSLLPSVCLSASPRLSARSTTLLYLHPASGRHHKETWDKVPLLYADDTQLYLTFPPPSSAYAVSKLVTCITEVRSWLTDDLLQLNDRKTEFLVIGSRDQLSLARVTKLTTGDTAIPAVHSARNLGAILESSCSVQSHVKAVCQSTRYYLRNLTLDACIIGGTWTLRPPG